MIEKDVSYSTDWYQRRWTGKENSDTATSARTTHEAFFFVVVVWPAAAREIAADAGDVFVLIFVCAAFGFFISGCAQSLQSPRGRLRDGDCWG